MLVRLEFDTHDHDSVSDALAVILALAVDDDCCDCDDDDCCDDAVATEFSKARNTKN